MITALLPLKAELPDGVGRAGTIGIRIPAHPVPRALVRLLGSPMATTSANRSGEPPLRLAEEAGRVWGEGVFALDGESGAVPSTVADFTVWPPKIVRPGVLGESVLMELVHAVLERD